MTYIFWIYWIWGSTVSFSLIHIHCIVEYKENVIELSHKRGEKDKTTLSVAFKPLILNSKRLPVAFIPCLFRAAENCSSCWAAVFHSVASVPLQQVWSERLGAQTWRGLLGSAPRVKEVKLKNINAKQLGKRMGSFTSAPALIFWGTGKRETCLKYKKMLLPCCVLSSPQQWEGKRPMAAMWEGAGWAFLVHGAAWSLPVTVGGSTTESHCLVISLSSPVFPEALKTCEAHISPTCTFLSHFFPFSGGNLLFTSGWDTSMSFWRLSNAAGGVLVELIKFFSFIFSSVIISRKKGRWQ